MKRLAAVLTLTAAMTLSTVAPAVAHQPHKRSDAVELGTYHAVGTDWKVKVVSFDGNANDRVGRYDSPPKAGHTYKLVRIRAKRVGKGEGNVFWDLSWNLFGGRSKRMYESCDNFFPPDWIGNEESVYRGGVVTTNICFEVPNTDRRFKLRLEDSMEWDYNASAWYRLR